MTQMEEITQKQVNTLPQTTNTLTVNIAGIYCRAANERNNKNR